jgi:RNA polymerase sigma factor (sigma-70 family)
MPDLESGIPEKSPAFPTTRWTHVQMIQRGTVKEAECGLEEICRLYWYPIYAYLRRKGFSAHDAEDFTQEFFQELISEDALMTVRKERGSLRGYLLGVLQRLLADDARHRTAQRRNPGLPLLSLDELSAEERYGREPQDTRDPEKLFAQAWAQEVFAAVRVRLGEAFAEAGRSAVFETLLPFLTCEEMPPSQREIAEKLGVSENAAGILVFRLRQTFRELLREEIATTVLSPEEIPAEMTWFQSMLSSR